MGVAKLKGLSAEIEKLPGKSLAYYFPGPQSLLSVRAVRWQLAFVVKEPSAVICMTLLSFVMCLRIVWANFFCRICFQGFKYLLSRGGMYVQSSMTCCLIAF